MSNAFQLNIPQPCHENWDHMTHDDKGRFCGSCQKQVVDFTGMSDSQLVAFFKKPSTGNVCGRFNNTQLDHDFEIPRKRIPWLKYFFTIALPAFFATTKATAQGEVRRAVKGQTAVKFVPDKNDTTLPASVTKCSPAIKPGLKSDSIPLNIILGNVMPKVIVGESDVQRMPVEKTITGKVIDEKGSPMPYATIRIKGSANATASNEKGEFKLNVPYSDTSFTVVASYVGYQTQEIAVSKSEKNTHIVLEPVQLGQCTIVTVGFTIRRPSKKTAIPLLKQIFRDTAFKNFKFHPNPATSGSVLTLEWNKKEEGEFEIQLLNQQGQIINRRYENFAGKLNSIHYPVPSVTPGSYFMVMINRKSGKKLTEKIIIQ